MRELTLAEKTRKSREDMLELLEKLNEKKQHQHLGIIIVLLRDTFKRLDIIEWEQHNS